MNVKILIAQTNTTPRDFYGNLDQIKKAIQIGSDASVDLVITPELSICGYSVKDLMYTKGFVEENLQWLQRAVDTSRGQKFFVIVGYIDRNNKGIGKPFKNMIAIIKNGTIVATYQKQLLPFYDVFDEGRYFEPGCDSAVIEINGIKWGLAICEDVFSVDKGETAAYYSASPVDKYKSIGINNIIACNSSPYVVGKLDKKINMFKEAFKKGTLIYCNQIGGCDDLIFDGHSMIITNGVLSHLSPTTDQTSYEIVEVFPKTVEEPKTNNSITMLHDMLVLGLRDYIRKCGFKTACVASSGGIDSAVVLALTCEAIGAKNVHAVRMPSIISSEHSKADALQLHNNLGCHDYLIPIEHESLIAKYNDVLAGQNDMTKYRPVADENIQARIRGTMIMHLSNAFGHLVITTGNKSEISVGYCTLYGDCNGGIAPLSDLYKTQVFELARYINREKEIIPNNILVKPPSAELAPGQTDEKSLLPYPVLDAILLAYIQDRIGTFEDYTEWVESFQEKNKLHIFQDQNEMLKQTRIFVANVDNSSAYNRIIRLVDNNEFKRQQMAKGLKVSNVAFGTGRRMPIAKK